MMNTNAPRTPPPPQEMAVHLPESKVVAAELESGLDLAGKRSPPPLIMGRKAEFMQVAVRALCLATSVAAVSFMVTARQSSTLSIYGFTLPVRSKWSFSHSFQYLVGVSIAVAAHSLLQLLIGTIRMLRKSPVIPSRSQAWLIFAGDQVLAYAMISAGAAASGVTNLNRTGIQHTALPNFCKPLRSFCDHVAVSIAFAFFSCCLLAASAVQEVMWLSWSSC